jgi:hypothetical protein
MEADQATWWDTLGRLQRILRKAAQVLFIAKKLDREQMHNYFMSGKVQVLTNIFSLSYLQ